MRLGTSSQCLLLTGPNAGGKTVVLKTLGLLALLVCSSVVVGGIICGPFEWRGAFFFPGCLRLAVEFQYLVEKPPEWIFLRHLLQHRVAGSAKLVTILLLITATGSRDHDVFCSASYMIHRM